MSISRRFAFFALCVVMLAGCTPTEDAEDGKTNYSDVKLESLSLTLIGQADNLIEFQPDIRAYTYSLPEGTEGTFKVSAEAMDNAEIIKIMPQAEFPAPAQTDGAKVITISLRDKATKKAGKPYSITVTPGQSQAENEYRLMSLSAQYEADGENLIAGFSPASTEYSVNAAEGETAVSVKALAMSAKSPVKIYEVNTEGAPKASGTGSAETTISVPASGSKLIIVDVSYGASGAGNHQAYKVTLNAYTAERVTYSGSAAYTGSQALSITGITARDAELSKQSPELGDGTDTNKAWTLEAAPDYAPVSFVVELKGADGKNYKSIAQYPAASALSGKTRIAVSVSDADIGKATACIQDLKDITNNDNGSYVLSDDLDLSELSSWDGPTDFGGKFRGNGYTIKNMVLDKTSGAAGFFSSLADGAVIEDFAINVSTSERLKNSVTVNSMQFGGVVGNAAASAVIRKVNVEGTLEFFKYEPSGESPQMLLGGLVGGLLVKDGAVLNIDKCSSNVNVIIKEITSTNFVQGIGGLIGLIREKVYITDSFAAGSININAPNENLIGVGGLVGCVGASESTASRYELNILRSYSSGELIVNSGARTLWERDLYHIFAGGLVGQVRSVKNISIKQSAALNSKAQTIAGGSGAGGSGLSKAYSARIYGGIANAVTQGGITGSAEFQNNIALNGMLTGTSAAGTPDNSVGALTQLPPAALPAKLTVGVSGYGLAESALRNVGVWTTQAADGAGFTGLGWSTDVWDFSGLARGEWPKIK